MGPRSSQRTSRNRKFVVFHVCVHDSLIPITLVRRISEFFVTLIFLLNFLLNMINFELDSLIFILFIFYPLPSSFYAC